MKKKIKDLTLEERRKIKEEIIRLYEIETDELGFEIKNKSNFLGPFGGTQR